MWNILGVAVAGGEPANHFVINPANSLG